MSKHVGFPAAPDVAGATEEEMAEDFEELGVSTLPVMNGHSWPQFITPHFVHDADAS